MSPLTDGQRPTGHARVAHAHLCGFQILATRMRSPCSPTRSAGEKEGSYPPFTTKKVSQCPRSTGRPHVSPSACPPRRFNSGTFLRFIHHRMLVHIFFSLSIRLSRDVCMVDQKAPALLWPTSWLSRCPDRSYNVACST